MPKRASEGIRVRQWGDAFYLLLPKEDAEALGLGKDDLVKHRREGNSIIYEPAYPLLKGVASA